MATWALGALRHAPRTCALLPALVRAAQLHAPQHSPLGVANTLWGLSRLVVAHRRRGGAAGEAAGGPAGRAAGGARVGGAWGGGGEVDEEVNLIDGDDNGDEEEEDEDDGEREGGQAGHVAVQEKQPQRRRRAQQEGLEQQPRQVWLYPSGRQGALEDVQLGPALDALEVSHHACGTQAVKRCNTVLPAAAHAHTLPHMPPPRTPAPPPPSGPGAAARAPASRQPPGGSQHHGWAREAGRRPGPSAVARPAAGGACVLRGAVCLCSTPR